MTLKQYGLSRLRGALNDSDHFLSIYQRLVREQELTDVEQHYILKVAIALLSMANKDKDSAYFGYSIIVRYTNTTGNYRALYDVALAHNYMPIVDLIERIGGVTLYEEELQDLFLGSLKSTFYDQRTSTYRSEGQLELVDFISNTDNIAVVAPTSYGKSELIIDSVRSALTLQKNVCIIVPTKALVTQTKGRLYARGVKRVITHPDMYNAHLYELTGFVAVLTQERVMSLLTANKEIQLDLIYVDEAHNMLEDDERSILLSEVLLVARKRNPNTDINYFTPFLSNPDNLSVLASESPQGFLTDERMKAERYYYRQATGDHLYFYDQFLDRSFLIHTEDRLSAANFVINNSSDKNIIYLNKPKDVSRFATDLASHLPDIEMNDDLEGAMRAIADYTHRWYNIIACLRKGVLFHHGSMPDVVKMYVENLYSSSSLSIKYLVTTSTLLEGVNIPADRLFIMNSSIGRGALSDSQLKNLAGRVCRYRELFSQNARDTLLLEPRIYLVNDTNYERATLKSPENFYSARVRVGKKIVDKVENPLLKENKTVEQSKLAKELSYLSNVEDGLTLSDHPIKLAQTPIGKACFRHNVRDFEIIANEATLNHNMTSRVSSTIQDSSIKNTVMLFDAISDIFIKNIESVEFSPTYFLAKAGVKEHHRWFLEQSIAHPSLNYLISIILYSWRYVTSPVFVGGMGDIDKEGNVNGRNTNYAYVNRKNQSEKVSLAISKIKVDQDMLENCIMKYLETLNDLGMVDPDYYNQVKYHTTDSFVITLLKQGASHDLAQLLASKYRRYIFFDDSEVIKTSISKEELLELMQTNEENDIIIFEYKNFI